MPATPIYLDNQATTRIDPCVLDAMLPYFCEAFGNASSHHAFGMAATEAVDRARFAIARSIGASSPAEIVFTSGATEADNLAIKGVAYACAEQGRHLITALPEHKAVLDSCKHLEQEGFQVTYLPVNSDGRINLNQLCDSITAQTTLVTIMAANNETGVLENIPEIGRICRERGVLFHTDSTQAVGKVPFHVQEMDVDLASITAHKVYGPKGIGALYVRRRNPRIALLPQMDGGGHEGGYRSGTLNVPGIVGLAKALELGVGELGEESKRLIALRERLKEGLRGALDGVQVNGHETQRLPGNLNVSFEGVTAERLFLKLPDIALSGASACSSGSAKPSHVLKALGLSDESALSAVRFGIGRFNTEEEIDYTLARVIEMVKRLRARKS